MFRRYLSWVYKGTVDLEYHEPGCDGGYSGMAHDLHVRMYLLADVLLDTQLKNRSWTDTSTSREYQERFCRLI